MNIIWDEFKPRQDAFQFARTEDDQIWIEVYVYPNPDDMRRWIYQVNIWQKADYVRGEPFEILRGRGGFKNGRFAAEEFFKNFRN